MYNFQLDYSALQKSAFNLFAIKVKQDWRFFNIGTSFKVDGYTLAYYENEDRYTISFIDSVGIEVEEEITEDIYNEYKNQYLKILLPSHSTSEI